MLYECPKCKEKSITCKSAFTPGKPSVVYFCKNNCGTNCIWKYCYLEEDELLVDAADRNQPWIHKAKDLRALILLEAVREHFHEHMELGDLWCDCLRIDVWEDLKNMIRFPDLFTKYRKGFHELN